MFKGDSACVDRGTCHPIKPAQAGSENLPQHKRNFSVLFFMLGVSALALVGVANKAAQHNRKLGYGIMRHFLENYYLFCIHRG